MSEIDPDRTKRLEKIRALINKANDPGATAAERESFLAKADEWMVQYSVEEFELSMARPAQEREKPIIKSVSYGMPDNLRNDDPWYDAYSSIFYDLAINNRCLVADCGWRSSKIVGYERDISHVEMMFTSIMLHLANEIDPQPLPGLPLGENVARMKNAGFKWERIHERLLRAGIITDSWSKTTGGTMIRAYKRYMADIGQEPVGIHPVIWRRSFLDGFVNRLAARLRQQSVKAMAGAGLVLAGMEEALKERLYEEYPDRRPHPEDCDCERCHSCSDPQCQRRNCKARRQPVKSYSRPRRLAVTLAGFQAGAASADRASLGGTGLGGKKGEIQ